MTANTLTDAHIAEAMRKINAAMTAAEVARPADWVKHYTDEALDDIDRCVHALRRTADAMVSDERCGESRQIAAWAIEVTASELAAKAKALAEECAKCAPGDVA